MTSLNEYVSINDILTTDMLDVIFKSSWKNDKMVLPVKAKTRNADKKLTIQSDKNGNPEYVRLTSKHSRMMYGDDGHVRPYIKIVDNKDINNTRVFNRWC